MGKQNNTLAEMIFVFKVKAGEKYGKDVAAYETEFQKLLGQYENLVKDVDLKKKLDPELIKTNIIKILNEMKGLTPQVIKKLKKSFKNIRNFNPHSSSGQQIIAFIESLSNEDLQDIKKAKIRHLSDLAKLELKSRGVREGYEDAQVKSYIDDIAHQMTKPAHKNLAPYADKFKKHAYKTMDPRKSLDAVLPSSVKNKQKANLLNMEFELDEGVEEIKKLEKMLKALERKKKKTLLN